MAYKERTTICENCGKQVTKRMPPEQRFCSLQCSAESRKIREVRTCKVCGKEFEYKPCPSSEAKNGGQYCSRKCKGIDSRCEPHICEVCGKTFQPAFNTSKRHCSPECAHESRRTGKMVNCEWCGREFYLAHHRLQNAQHYFCCSEHQIKWQRRNQLIFTCKICGQTFRWSPSRTKNNNPTYCSLECRDKDPERKAMLLRMTAKQQKLKINKLEIAGYLILESLNLKFESQKPIANKFVVDAFLPNHNTIIQFDGDYWHGHPERFPDPDERQRKRMQIDTSQNAYFEKCGFEVLRFWGSDVKKRPDWVRNQIASALHL